MKTKVTLLAKLQGFFLGGGSGTQEDLAKKFSTSTGTIRKTVSALRDRGFQIEKILPIRANKPLHAEYRASVTSDINIPKLGRPSHTYKFHPHNQAGL